MKMRKGLALLAILLIPMFGRAESVALDEMPWSIC